MKNKFKKTILIISIILLLVFGACFLFVYKEIKNNIKITEQLKIDLQAEISKREEVKALNNYFKSIEKEKALFETHFIQSSDVVPFLNTLENLAKNVNTKAEISSISIDGVENKKELFIDMKDVGTFEQVYKFLTLLENSPYELEIMSIDMQNALSEEGTKKTNLWEATLKLKLISFI